MRLSGGVFEVGIGLDWSVVGMVVPLIFGDDLSIRYCVIYFGNLGRGVLMDLVQSSHEIGIDVLSFQLNSYYVK